jgi:nucleotide-binding universal stress UspA family protein
MYKTILAPLDGSKRAEAILPHVEEAARRYNAKVIFMQVIEQTMLFVDPQIILVEKEQFEEVAKQAEAYLEGLRGEFRKKGIEVRTLTARGPTVKAIINAAEHENADLIAIASHGRTGLSRVFYGSVAAGILHRIDRPLLLIRSS